MPYGLLHDTLPPEALITTSMNEGDSPPYLVKKSDA